MAHIKKHIINLSLYSFVVLLRQQLKMTAVSLYCFKSVPKVSYFTTNRNIVCALSFLNAAHGCLINLTVNSTSPVPLHLLMRVRVWLAESCSSARRGQSSLGRVEKKITDFSYETIHGCWSWSFHV